MVSCCEILEKHLDEKIKNHETIEVRELSASHSTNIIASVAFGIDIDYIIDPNVDFCYYFLQHRKLSIKTSIKHTLKLLGPNIMKLLRIKWIDDDVEKFMINVDKENIEYYEKNGLFERISASLLKQLRNEIDVEPDDQWKSTTRIDGKYDLTIEEITAQAFVFFAADFDTSPATLSWFLYELALNPEIQRKVCDEIDEVLERYMMVNLLMNHCRT